jgi:Fic family protein
MEQLIQTFMDRYLTREEIAYRLPVTLPITKFWPAMEQARKAAAIMLPLKTQSGEPFWFVCNKSIEEQCNAVAEMARKGYLLDALPGEIMEEATIDEAVWSSVIEGAFTSRQQAAKIIKQDKKPSNQSEQMVKNNYQAMLYVLEHLEDPITEEMLIDIAGILTRNASEEQVDGFRTVPVYVTGRDGVVYTPPSAEQVPHMIADLLDFIHQSKLHPLFKACIAHFYFVYIHPFTDGNGRTARALSLMMLLRTGYDFFRFFSVSGIIAEERGSYYKAMRNVEADGSDMTYFVDTYSAILAKSVNQMEKHLLHHVLAERTIKYLESSGKLNERQLKGARWLLEGNGTQVTVDAWKKKFQTAAETARQDLLTLCDEGILEKTIEGRKAVFHVVYPQH